jgi:hypothetical protein
MISGSGGTARSLAAGPGLHRHDRRVKTAARCLGLAKALHPELVGNVTREDILAQAELL